MNSSPVSHQEVTHYLVKWCSLPYEESTWELEEDVDPAKVKEFESLQILPEIKHVVTYPCLAPVVTCNFMTLAVLDGYGALLRSGLCLKEEKKRSGLC